MVPFRYNVRSLLVRKATTVATALGVALVVFTLAASQMLVSGVHRALRSSGRDDNVIVMRKGSDIELASILEEENVRLVLAAPGVRRDEQGRPVGVGEAVMVAAMDKLDGSGLSNVQIRGVPDGAIAFRPEVRVIAGRPPKPGADEAFIGTALRGRFKGFELGQQIYLRSNRPLNVVGFFDAGGSSYESEVWANLDAARTSFGREGTVSTVRVRLESPEKFDALKAVVEQDKNLGFLALRETDYYEKQSENTTLFITALGSMVTFFFSLGAIIGAAITMYAAVANRRREIGTLRALGFGRRSIVFSFLLESTALALVGGAAGLAAAMLLKFVRFSAMNWQTWSEIVFSFEPTPDIIVSSAVFAVVLGVFGGLLPALRASRVPPAEAMRG
ncbi:MAG: FtsX-like permease family protein [Polyangiaceae bacterium]|jgi:putative ABC transport system permease protein|nr:FtsX-like permease family protein [Polyangiaceae bacterium]